MCGIGGRRPFCAVQGLECAVGVVSMSHKLQRLAEIPRDLSTERGNGLYVLSVCLCGLCHGLYVLRVNSDLTQRANFRVRGCNFLFTSLHMHSDLCVCVMYCT